MSSMRTSTRGLQRPDLRRERRAQQPVLLAAQEEERHGALPQRLRRVHRERRARPRRHDPRRDVAHRLADLLHQILRRVPSGEQQPDHVRRQGQPEEGRPERRRPGDERVRRLAGGRSRPGPRPRARSGVARGDPQRQRPAERLAQDGERLAARTAAATSVSSVRVVEEAVLRVRHACGSRSAPVATARNRAKSLALPSSPGSRRTGSGAPRHGHRPIIARVVRRRTDPGRRASTRGWWASRPPRRAPPARPPGSSPDSTSPAEQARSRHVPAPRAWKSAARRPSSRLVGGPPPPPARAAPEQEHVHPVPHARRRRGRRSRPGAASLVGVRERRHDGSAGRSSRFPCFTRACYNPRAMTEEKKRESGPVVVRKGHVKPPPPGVKIETPVVEHARRGGAPAAPAVDDRRPLWQRLADAEGRPAAGAPPPHRRRPQPSPRPPRSPAAPPRPPARRPGGPGGPAAPGGRGGPAIAAPAATAARAIAASRGATPVPASPPPASFPPASRRPPPRPRPPTRAPSPTCTPTPRRRRAPAAASSPARRWPARSSRSARTWPSWSSAPASPTG